MNSPRHDLIKLYYRIGEVSQIVGVQPHVLRYWESEFRSIRPQKSNKGQRIYSRRDVEKLLRVKDLLKNQGFTIAGARKQLLVRSDDTASSSAPGTPQPTPAAESERQAVAAVAPAAALQPPPRADAKQLRRALVHVRADVLKLLEALDADGAADAGPTRRG